MNVVMSAIFVLGVIKSLQNDKYGRFDDHCKRTTY